MTTSQAQTDGLTVRPVSTSDFDEVLKSLETVVGMAVDIAEAQYLRQIAEYDRTFAIFDGERLAATAAAQTLELTVPGGAAVPMAAMLWARVMPDYRRRGLMTRLIHARIDQAKERGEPVAGMWLADSAMHSRGKIGFGWATSSAHLEVRRPYAAMNVPVETRGRVDVLDPKDAVASCVKIYDDVRTQRAGMLSRSSARWDGWTWRNPEHWLDRFWTADTGPLMVALWGDEGYLSYRMKRAWVSGGAEYTMLVAELVTRTAMAYHGLWQWCFASDLVTRFVAAQRPTDDPLKHIVVAPRRVATNVTDGLWIYLVDACAALERRKYERDGRVILKIHDALRHNSGTYELSVDGGSATCQPTGRPADVELPMATLASCYLGDSSLRMLASFGKAEELAAGQLATLDGMLRTSTPPWCPWVF